MRLTVLTVVLLVLAGLLMAQMTSDRSTNHHPHAAELVGEDGSPKYTNALIDETSPYLRQHAHNPVDWHPWGEEAFELARREQKPIFLSIGYSTCYWCHVMERQVFESPAIAAEMNAKFVNIKVDREERPDVDDVYMTATQLMTGQGGWPMSVFLTPPPPEAEQQATDGYGLKPFWAGTYLPPEPMHGRPSFPQVLQGLHEAWTERRAEVLQQAEKLADAVTQQLDQQHPAGEITPAGVQTTLNQLLGNYDATHGGFGDAPKFPQPSNLAFLLAVHRNNPSPELWDAIAHTLDAMARGGMYDQVGGGFHRYSTDAKWLVPHFEKMLYDNAQLLEVYATAYTRLEEQSDVRPGIAEQRVLYERVLRETANYVLREMTDPATGLFYTAQDAEVNASEGQNYVWTPEQFREAIDDPAMAKLALKMYGLDRGTNFQDPHDAAAKAVNVLYLPEPLPQLAEQLDMTAEELAAKRAAINEQLLAVRDRRDQPLTDTKTLAAWNGMLIAGLADTGRELDEQRYIEAAARAAEALLEHMQTEDGGLYRTWRDGEAKIPGFLEDYAYVIHGLLALHRATGTDRWLVEARRLTAEVEQRFAAEGGGYFDMLAGRSDLFVRTRSTYDGAVPSGNSQMLHNLVDLAERTGGAEYLQRAKRDAAALAGPMRRTGVGMIHAQHAVLKLLEAMPHGTAKAADAKPQAAEEAIVTPSVYPIENGKTTLTLRIAEGYHINANEVDSEMLIPTTLTLEAGEGVTLAQSWPEPERKRYPFSDMPLAVYEGEIEVNLTLEGAVPAGATLLLRYQACTETACLAPETVSVPLPRDE